MRGEIVKAPRSAYLHIPFCHKRCFYCDFAVIPLGNSAQGGIGPGIDSIKSYLNLLCREISISPLGPPLSTIYIGGGTPSLLNPEQISFLLSCLREKFGVQSGAEITMEIDPATFTKKDLGDYLTIGINRLSLGGQSFNNAVLNEIGRTHNKDQLLEACNWLKEMHKHRRLSSWSLDLIQNLPGENMDRWEQQLKLAVNSYAPHLSIYDLSVEPGTVFASKYKKGQLNLPNDDLAAEINSFTSLYLSDAGYSRYEISSYCLPGFASRHNRMYWSGSGWWGFGMSATSSPWGQRFARPKKISNYKFWLEKQEKDGLEETLLQKNYRQMPLDELLMIGLRRREGINLEVLSDYLDWDQKKSDLYLSLLQKEWQPFVEKGWLIRTGKRYQLSDPEGMGLINQVIIQMFVWWENLPTEVVDSEPISEVFQ